MARNIECVGCLARFNVDYSSSLANAVGGRFPLLVFAERIPSEADGGGAWREDMFPKVLQ